MKGSLSLGVLALGSCLAAPAAAADLPALKEKGVLRVLVHLDERRPEFFSVKAGREPGFDHEMLEGFATLHRLELKVVPVPGWDALVPALLQGRGDVIAGRFSETEGRRKLIHFTSEVFPSRLVVITRKPTRVVGSLQELRAEKVGTVKGTNMAEALAALDIPPGRLDDGIPTGGLVEALRSGRATAVVWGVESAMASQREDPALQLGMFLGPPGHLAWGVRKADAELLRELNAYIENHRRTPSWSRLVVKYFGESAPDILKKARAN